MKIATTIGEMNPFTSSEAEAISMLYGISKEILKEYNIFEE